MDLNIESMLSDLVAGTTPRIIVHNDDFASQVVGGVGTDKTRQHSVSHRTMNKVELKGKFKD